MDMYEKIVESLTSKVSEGVLTEAEANEIKDKAYAKYVVTTEGTVDPEMYAEYEAIVEGIQEKVDNGEMTIEDAEAYNELAYDKYVTESFTQSPLKKMVEKLKKIKNEKPSEFDGPKEVKEFVDKNFDDIEKASGLLQEEPEKLAKDERNYLVSTGVAFIGYMGGVILMAANPIVGVATALVSGVWMVISSIAWTFIKLARTNADVESMKSLSKIKIALKKLDNKKLPEEYKKKVSKLIQDIDDAETDVYSKLKKVSD